MNYFLPNSSVLERPQIDNILREAGRLPLSMLVAPMGYGKTTIIQNFLDQKEGTKIWLSFGPNEVDEVWIWTRLCGLFESLGYPFASLLSEHGLPQNQYEADNILSALEDSFPDPCYLVLDDCHECKSPKLIQLLENAVNRRIKNLHIFLLSRTYPELHYEELWNKGDFILIGQSTMALSPEEITAFFSLNGIPLSKEEQFQIYDYTEGWTSAVYLVLMDYRQYGQFRNLGGINNLVHTFIFENISEIGKQILMRLCLFDAFPLDLAVYVTQMEECRLFLSRLLGQLSFVQYNSATEAYSLHTILRSVLVLELKKSGIDAKQLYFRAASWYEEQELYIYAIRYYQKAGASSRIFNILKENCSALYEAAPSVIRSFFTNIGTRESLEHPASYLSYIGSAILHEEFIRGRALFEEAKEYYSSHTSEELSQNEILGALYMIQWSLTFNDLEKMTECASKAYELLGGKSSSLSPFHFILTYGAPENLFLYHRTVGGLKQIVALEKQYTSYYMRLISGTECDWEQLYDAEYLFTTGEIPAADQLAAVACQKAVIHKQPCVIISSYFVRLRCQIFLGKPAVFQQLLAELKAEMEHISSSTIRMSYDVSLGYLYGFLNQLDKIAPWILDFRLENCNRVLRSVRSGCVSYGLTLIQKKDWVRLEILADEMSVPYSNSSHTMVTLYAKLYYAISAWHLYGLKKGQEHLAHALALAQPDNIKMPFVECISFLEPLLKEISAQDSFAAEICMLGKTEKRGFQAILENISSPSHPHLTQRETELMTLVAQGYRNTEISQHMHVALVTVEKKLTTVYRKLGVSNRSSAIRVLRDYHILD